MRQRTSRRLFGFVLSLALTLSCASPGTTPSSPAAPDPFDLPRSQPGRLPAIAAPLLYQLDLRVDPGEERFFGETRIHLRVDLSTRAIPFHAKGLRIDEMWIETTGGRRIRGEVARLDDGDPDFGERLALLDEQIDPGPALLFLRYTAPFARSGTGLVRMGDAGARYAVGLGAPMGARSIFPCLDEPASRAPFRVALTVPNGMSAHSNAPLSERVVDGSFTLYRFAETPPISPHLVAFAVGDFEVVEGPRRPTPIRGLRTRTDPRSMDDALRLHAELLDLLEGWFDSPYPFAKLDVVAVPGLPAVAMESPGLILYDAQRILFEEESEEIGLGEEPTLLIAHELAHMWLGNLVTMEWWDDLWLSEALANWVGARVVGLLRPKLAQRAPLLDWRARAFDRDASASVRSIRQPVAGPAEAAAAFDSITYFKGALLLGMVEQWMGPSAFRGGLQEYLRTHAWSSATTEDLLLSLERGAGGDRPIRSVIESFSSRPGMPRIEVGCEVTIEGAQAVLSQSRYLPLGTAGIGEAEEPIWTVPVCIAWPGVDGEVVSRCHLLDEEMVLLPLDGLAACPAWIHPNAGERGHYRWATGVEELQGYASALLRPWSEEHPAGFDPAERGRIALPGQLLAMVLAGDLDPGSYLSLSRTLVSTGDDQVLEGVVRGLIGLVSTFEDLPESEGFRRWLASVLEPRAKDMGWAPIPGEDLSRSRARDDLLRLLGRGGVPWVLAGAEERARSWSEDPAARSREVSWGVLAIAASSGTLDRARLVAIVKNEASPRARSQALQVLAYLPPGEELAQALPLLLDPALVGDHEVRPLLFKCMRRPEAREQAFDFMMENFDSLARRADAAERRGAIRLAEAVGFFCEPGPRDAAHAFFLALDTPGIQAPLALGHERSEQCIAARAFGEVALRDFLSVAAR